MSSDSTDALGLYRLREWPFREVPEPTRCTFIAGRPGLRSTLDRFVAPSANTVSAIYLFWASLGAGKTHALYYLMNKMDSPQFLPIYSEYPESTASFVELYGKLARNIRWDQIAESCFQLFAEADEAASRDLSRIRLVQPDIYRAFFLLAEGEDKSKAKIATRWLRGEMLTKAELREASLASSLRTPGDCAGVISVLSKMLAINQRSAPNSMPLFRLVWIIDECQRLGAASSRLNQEVNAGLQSTFNSTPDHLTLILSFTGKPERELPKWLRPELADRIGARNLVLLPPLSREDSRTFLLELLKHYRTPGPAVGETFPFTEESITYVINRLSKGGINAFGLGGLVEKEGIRPRALIKCCGAIVQEHLDKRLPLPIDEKFAASMLPR